MKVVILAGGLGTRLRRRRSPTQADGGDRRPTDPLAHHEALRAYGFNEFVVALGYKGDVIKRYFLGLLRTQRSITCRLGTRKVDVHRSRARATGRCA